MSYLQLAQTAEMLDTPAELPTLAKPLVAGGLAIRHAAQVLVNGTASLVGLQGPWDESQEEVERFYGRTIGKFYGDNEGAINTTGEIAALFAPGFGASKALQYLSKAAESTKSLRYYRAVDGLGKQRKYEAAAKKAAEGTEAFGDYTRVWAETRKAYAAGALASVQEGMAQTALSYALLKNTNLFEDYSAKDFAFESLFAGSIGAGFRYFGSKRAAKAGIAEFETKFQAANFVPASVKGLKPSENLLRMFWEREGIAYTDQASRDIWTRNVKATFKELTPDAELHAALDKYVTGIATQSALGTPGATEEISKLLVGMKSIGRIGPSDPAKLTMYLDTQTGNLTDSAIMGAAERGVTLGSQKAVIDNTVLGPKNFLEDLSQMDAGHADALHMLAVKMGREGKGFEYPGVVLGGKVVAQSFFADTPFHLAAAREFAKKHGKAVLIGKDKNVIAQANVDEIARRQLELNDSLAADLYAKGHTAEAVELKLNTNPLDGPNAKTKYADRTDKGLTTPRFLQTDYELANVGERDVAIASILQTGFKQVYKDRVTESFDPIMSNLGVKLDGYIDEFTGTAATTDAPGLFGFGGQGVAGGFRNQIEQIGVITENAGREIATKFTTTIASKIVPLLRNTEDRVKWATYKNEISANPAVLEFREDAVGDLYLFNTETKDVAKKFGTDEALPPLTGNVRKAFEIEMQELHPSVVGFYNSIKRFDGMGGREIDASKLYAAPANDSPFFALVKYNNGVKRFINANSEQDLSLKIAEVQKAQGKEVASIQRKGEIKLAKEVEGLFDPGSFFQNMSANIDSYRSGAAAAAMLGDGSEQLNRMIAYYNGFGKAAAMQYTAKRYANELGVLKNQQERLGLSYASTLGKRSGSLLGEQKDEFDRIANVMLGRSNVGSYKAFATANQTVSEIVSEGYYKFANTLKSVASDKGTLGALARGVLPDSFSKEFSLANSKLADELNEFVSKFHVKGTDYRDVAQQLVLNASHSPQAATKIVTGMNAFFATGQLGLDVLNTAVNFLSFPLTQIPELKNLRKNLLEGRTEGLEGIAIKDPNVGGKLMLSPHKLVENTFDSWANPSKYQAQWERYVAKGIVTPQSFAAQLAHEDLAKSFATRDAGLIEKAWFGFIGKAREWLVERPNNFMQFASAHAVDDVLMRAGIADEKLRMVRVAQHVRRTQHNFPGSQRPILFNGPIGSAVSLYQTFQFNTIQNLARYMGEGDKKAVATFMGIQTATFGLQSNPLFHAANSMIAYRKGNYEREDLYTKLQDADGLLYGPISSGLNVNLYSRGDITPRTAVLLPTEVQNIPLIAQSIKAGQAIGSLIDGLSTAVPGGEPSRVVDSVLTATQQLGISRPLAGIAATLQGQSVDQNGNKIVDTEAFSFATLTRFAGGRTFDEAKLREVQYRTAAYQAKDNKLLEELGQDYRSQIRTYGDFDLNTWKGFVEKYADSGGEMRNMQRWLIRNHEKAGSDIASRLAKRYENDPDMQPWLEWIASEAAGGGAGE